jgi:hypothetical protein
MSELAKAERAVLHDHYWRVKAEEAAAREAQRDAALSAFVASVARSKRGETDE